MDDSPPPDVPNCPQPLRPVAPHPGKDYADAVISVNRGDGAEEGVGGGADPVFGGALMLGVVCYRGMAGQFNSRHHDMVEATSLYWHFVDVVWILLFSILYLL